MLPTLNISSKTLDTSKQMALMRNYLNELKDSTESELYNIQWGNLAKPLQDKINELDRYAVSTNEQVSSVAQNLTANYLTAKTIETNYLSAQQIAAQYATVGTLNALAARVGTVEANYVSANYLQTNYLTSQQVSANYATITNLNGVSARLQTVEANYVTAYEVSANYATIGSLNGVSARVGTIESNYITASYINASNISAAFTVSAAGTFQYLHIVQGSLDNMFMDTIRMDDEGGTRSVHFITVDGHRVLGWR